MRFKRHQSGNSTPDRSYLPVMGESDLRDAVRDGGTGMATALLVYDAQVFEVVNGQFRTAMEDEGTVSYWVGDRLVAVMHLGEDVQVVPALRSLRTNFTFPLVQLTTEQQEAV
jgi:hypothetical protein